jgi:hypothetical protein
MRKFMTLLGALAMLLAISGTANAGYWRVTYDMAGSVVTFDNPSSIDLTDPLTGTWKIDFDATSAAMDPPYTGVRLNYGKHFVDINQALTSPVPFTIDGQSTSLLLVDAGGQPTTLSGQDLAAFNVPDQTTSGFLHCKEPTAAPFCLTAGLPPVSAPFSLRPASSDRPTVVEIPKVVFTGAAGAGVNTKFTSDPSPPVPAGPATTSSTVYRGTELARHFVTGNVPALSGGALAGLAGFLLIGGTLTLALRNRS